MFINFNFCVYIVAEQYPKVIGDTVIEPPNWIHLPDVQNANH